ncbi:zinc-binding alcohol dehydrogenase [Candidatus Poribacteria bacterium]|jgi:NADPH:quinone reductase|nr:zinc-binding alcohol dehydrogenase [Candidatus Poribacteria bacterium]MBT5713707.1 zinc-binding alcohol dehydrogenase [Candidatus Poribacteria bacterium]MBT7806612.1 zinc-binding alcohol dehydrogenase [Candidatus Poribacteria bacterium]
MSYPATRKVVMLDGAGRIWTAEEEMPAPRDGQLVVEVVASMVSPGTELGGVRRRREEGSGSASGRPFGYTNAGVVIGTTGDCSDFHVGDRVGGMGGGYALHATHACIPHNLCAKIPDGVPFEHAASNHLAATALHAVRRGRFALGESIAVAGLGLVGQLACQIAKIAGVYVVGLDRFPLRVEIARRVGAPASVNVANDDPEETVARVSRGQGLDGAIIAFGGDGTEAFKQLRGLLKTTPDGHKMGRIVIVGGASIQHGFAAGAGNIDVISAARTGPGYHDDAYEHGADYPPVFVPWPTRRNLELTLRFMAEGRLDVGSLITDTVHIDDASDACDKLIESPGDALGVVFTMGA